MTSVSDKFDIALQRLASDIASAVAMENALSGRSTAKASKSKKNSTNEEDENDQHLCGVEIKDAAEIARQVVNRCKRKREEFKHGQKTQISNEELSQLAPFTDKFNLAPFRHFLQYVPRLVNVVTLAEAIPVEGSGVTLPLDLRVIAARCKNAYYAPKKFSAVQLAYSEPRCRVLVFHTGRLVGTGCGGPMAARLALLRAQRQLYQDAKVNIHVRNFAVINQVGAFNLRATLNCEEFANVHSSTAHYDVKSFVGLAWRPVGEPICCEIYGTGRANLPGSVVERQLQDSLSRMFPELLRYSSSSRMLSLVPENLKYVHHVTHEAPEAASKSGKFVPIKSTVNAQSFDLWDGWADNTEQDNGITANDASDDEDDLDLSAMGV